MPNLRQSPAADISREFQTGLPPDVRVRPYISAILLTEDVSDLLPAGASEEITFLPPEGYLYKVIAPAFWVGNPAGATSGDHNLSIYSGWSYLFGVYCEWLYNVRAELIQFEPTTPNLYKPNDLSAFVTAMLSLRGDKTWGIKFVYVNNTDVDQTYTRSYRLLALKERV